MYDNRIFNVNGQTQEQLLLALKLAIQQKDAAGGKIAAYEVTHKHGMVLYWHPGTTRDEVGLPVLLTPEEMLPMIWAWLQGASGVTVCEGWDKYGTHDGDNLLGWRVFVEDWGKVDGYDCICAVKPAFLWRGK